MSHEKICGWNFKVLYYPKISRVNMLRNGLIVLWDKFPRLEKKTATALLKRHAK